jgi:hypothetical protein
VNLPFGARFVSSSTGILLNNEMDDFSTGNRENAFGLAPAEANEVVGFYHVQFHVWFMCMHLRNPESDLCLP